MAESISTPETPVELPGERRAWIRYGGDTEVNCKSPSPRKDYGWSGKIRNVSNVGIGLLLRHRFRPGTPLLIELSDRSGRPLRTIPARVMHASAARSDTGPCWLIGCSFSYELPEEEVRSLHE